MSDTYQMDLAETIKEYRERAGLTQRALAARLGITHSAIAQWEAGTTRPSFPVLIRASGILQMPLDGLIGPGTWYEGELVEDIEERTLLAEWRELGAEDRACLLRFVRGARQTQISSAVADRRRTAPRAHKSEP